MRPGRTPPQTARCDEGAVTKDHAPHLIICFDGDGVGRFFPEGDLSQCVESFCTIIKLLHEHPEAVRCALGLCQGAHEHGAL